MTKLMLVEDDNNLREIYGARLQAEGYEIVSAKDGEEALALAVKERPDLIISDVMMPKISGFDMLDILRSTTETKDTKVIMMTALSQKEDQERGEKLGADRYLVKSQVTLEDVVTVVAEVLNTASPAVVAEAPVVIEAPVPAPVAVSPAPVVTVPTPEPVAAPVAPVAVAVAPAPVAVPEPVVAPAPAPVPTSVIPVEVAPNPDPKTMAPMAEPNPQVQQTSPSNASVTTTQPVLQPTPPSTDSEPVLAVPASPEPTETAPASTETPHPLMTNEPAQPTSRKGKVIRPISDPANKVDINVLLAREQASQMGGVTIPATSTVIDPLSVGGVETAVQEQSEVNQQIQQFVNAQTMTSNGMPQEPAKPGDISL